MLFNSYGFLLLFLPVTVAAFFLIARHSHAAGAAWLASASFFFYGWWSPRYVLLLAASVAFNYSVGQLCSRALLAGRTRQAWQITFAGVVVDLLCLGYFKYANFFVSNWSTLTGSGWTIETIILPIGISFFTFTQIAFLVDTYQGKAREYNPIHYALFVSYFPHLVAGPILHHKEMMPQFEEPRVYRPNAENFAVGLTIFFIGLFKKAVLADGVAPYVPTAFQDAASGGMPSFFDAWGSALAYTCQLYFDFSGYSDMAIGLSRLFGIVLPLNFNSPYKAQNIVEFWRRWHMTLSRFLREYLYFPLGGNRHGPMRRHLNLLITMLLGGLWHGAAWTFVVWGAFHAIYLMINHTWHACCEAMGFKPRGFAYRLFSHGATLLAVVVAWVFFRASDLSTALGVLQGMLGMNGVTLPAALATPLGGSMRYVEQIGIAFTLGGAGQFVKMYSWITILLAIALFLPNTQELMRDYRPALGYHVTPTAFLLRWTPNRRWAIAAALIAGVGILSLYRRSEFIYFQF